MLAAPGKRCPKCPNLQPCAVHRRRWGPHPRVKGGNGWQWSRIRARILQRDHNLCRIQAPGCALIATEIDHILNIASGGTDDDANLRAVCKPCHAEKTRRESHGVSMGSGPRS